MAIGLDVELHLTAGDDVAAARLALHVERAPGPGGAVEWPCTGATTASGIRARRRRARRRPPPETLKLVSVVGRGGRIQRAARQRQAHAGQHGRRAGSVAFGVAHHLTLRVMRPSSLPTAIGSLRGVLTEVADCAGDVAAEWGRPASACRQLHRPRVGPSGSTVGAVTAICASNSPPL